jgi:hypothetical protein
LQEIIKVLAIADKWRCAFSEAPEDGQNKIEQGQARKNQRQEEIGSQGVVHAVKIEAEKCGQKPQNGAAGVAHKDFCRREVEKQEANAGAEETPRDGGAYGSAPGCVQQDVTEANERGDA